MMIELIQNNIILSCFLAWVITQTSKGLIISYKKNKFRWGYLLATGHMPSSHSGIVSSLVAAVYLDQGFTHWANWIYSLEVPDVYGISICEGKPFVVDAQTLGHLQVPFVSRYAEIIRDVMLDPGASVDDFGIPLLPSILIL